MQQHVLRSILHLMDLRRVVLHHGDATGFDKFCHGVAEEFDVGGIVIHPPSLATHRAWCQPRPGHDLDDWMDEERPYMERNEVIVKAVTLMIAAPRAAESESPRSGTWATKRRAEARGVPTLTLPY
jgi:hypothetical protein